MSGQCTGWVLRHGPRPIDLDREGKAYGTARARGLRAVLTTVADAANRDGEHAHPGLAAVIEGSLYSRRQALRLLTDLESEGWLTITEPGGGRGVATVYRVNMDRRRNGAMAPTSSERNGAISGRETVPSEQPAPLFPNGNTNGRAATGSRTSLLPESFALTAEMRAWAREHAPAVDIDEELEQFRDHWRGKGERRAEWVATWRTWMRNAQKWNRGGPVSADELVAPE